MTTSGGGCIPLRELDTYMKPTGSLGFDWIDLTSSYTFSTLTVLGNTGSYAASPLLHHRLMYIYSAQLDNIHA